MPSRHDYQRGVGRSVAVACLERPRGAAAQTPHPDLVTD